MLNGYECGQSAVLNVKNVLKSEPKMDAFKMSEVNSFDSPSGVIQNCNELSIM